MKKTRLRSPGARSAIASASSIAGGWAVAQLVLNASVVSCCGGRGGHLLAERVADLRAEQRREPVEVALAVGVEDVGALAALEHQQRLALGSEGAVAREVHQQVAVRALLQVGRGERVRGGHVRDGRHPPGAGNGRTVAIRRPHHDEPSTAHGVSPLRAQAGLACHDTLGMERLAANGLEPRLRGGAAEVARRLCGVQAQDAAAARLAIRARTEGLRGGGRRRASRRSCGRGRGAGRCTCWRARTCRGCCRWWPSGRTAPWRPAGARSASTTASTRGRAAAIVERLASGPATRAQLREALAAGRGRRERPAPPPPRPPRRARGPAPPPARRHLRRARAARSRRRASRRWPSWAAATPPATAPRRAADLAAFSGLPAAEARAAWPTPTPVRARATGGAAVVRLLGSFDPYLLGYKGREHAVAPEHARRVWPGGGWMHPVVLVDGTRRRDVAARRAARSRWTRSGRSRRRRWRPRSPTSRASSR